MSLLKSRTKTFQPDKDARQGELDSALGVCSTVIRRFIPNSIGILDLVVFGAMPLPERRKVPEKLPEPSSPGG